MNFLIALFSQISPEPWTQYGLSGSMLAWFALRAERRMKAMEVSGDRQARGIALLVITLNPHNSAVRDQANEIVDAIEKKRPAPKED